MSSRPVETRRDETWRVGVTTPPLAASGDAEDLYSKRTRARAVELGHQNALPLPQHDFPTADLKREVVAQKQRAEVRVGIHPIAVGMFWIVVHPLGVASDHLFEEALDVGEQGHLKFV